jgi:MFS family permease
MTDLKYSQGAVNTISIAAELAMYLPVPVFGYLCDRSGPRPGAILAALFFGGGYLTAAVVYRSGPPELLGGSGWPLWMMVFAFILVGMGTSCMYLSAVSTCAKNFGRGKYKGIALAIPIAAFGLSGMLVSQIGSRLLYVTLASGRHGDVDVFKFFVFLGALLFVVGILGGFALKVVDEVEMIDEAIDVLEQSGILGQDEFFERAADRHGYGTIDHHNLSNSQYNLIVSHAEDLRMQEAEERARKTWLLNSETRRFLSDHTMWWLAAGFFLVTGPGEAYINNMGTIIGTLYPPSTRAEDIPTSAATHVSVIALTSTFSRLLTGGLSDLLAPISEPNSHNRGPHSAVSSLASLPPRKFSISRLYFLLAFAFLLALGQALLATGMFQNHGDQFWIVSAFIGGGYGAVFSLTPIIISVVWGVENFATNWGIVATVPAAGAAFWGIVYATVYENAADKQDPSKGHPDRDGMCYGQQCYAPTFWAMAGSVILACGLILFAWRGPGGWRSRGVPV